MSLRRVTFEIWQKTFWKCCRVLKTSQLFLCLSRKFSSFEIVHKAFAYAFVCFEYGFDHKNVLVGTYMHGNDGICHLWTKLWLRTLYEHPIMRPYRAYVLIYATSPSRPHIFAIHFTIRAFTQDSISTVCSINGE